MAGTTLSRVARMRAVMRCWLAGYLVLRLNAALVIGDIEAAVSRVRAALDG